MATATLSPPIYETFADDLKQLGDIPAERIWLQPPPGKATEKDVIRIEAHLNRLCELVDAVISSALSNISFPYKHSVFRSLILLFRAIPIIALQVRGKN